MNIGRTPRWPLLPMSVGFVLLFMLQAPGKLTADTKLDVPLAPWRFMAAATHLWNPTSDFGFLPNQYVGYLFPMGPFFALGNLLGVPPWISQRLWMALLLTVAAWGTVRLADALGIGRPTARVTAGLGYALSPMFLGKIGATSVAMAGAAMLPWITLPLVLALRPDGAKGADTGHADDGGPASDRMVAARLSPRRAAALSGLAVLCTGGINATVTLCVLVCPAVLLLLAGGTKRAWALRAWWCLSVVLGTAWWMLALAVQGRYGLNFLPYTESAETTTGSTPVGESLRGTTDWLAYLQLPTPWLPAATEYISLPAAIVGSAVVAAIGLWGLTRADLPARRFLMITLLVGVVSVSAAYPGQPGSPLADGVRALLSEQLGFLRNVYKFQPVVRLPLALGLAHALTLAWDRGLARRTAAVPADETDTALPRRRPWRADPWRRAVPGVVGLVTVGALVAGMVPALAGDALQPRPFKEIPPYWVEAADWLADNPAGGRTLVLPGAPFAEYEWGRPLDEPLQFLAESPWGVRSLIPLGGVGVTRLMDGIERHLATGSAPGLAVALERAGIGQILIRNDLEDRDWDVPPSTDQIHRALESSGLTRAATFGPDVPVRLAAKVRLVPELADTEETVPALEVWTVSGGVSLIESYPAETALIVSGGPEATVQLAGQGLLNSERAVILASDLTDEEPAGDPTAADVLTPTTAWVATDTLTRRDHKFGIIRDSASYLLGPEENVAGEDGPPNQWIDRPTDDHQTVAGYTDGMSVHASSYGYDLRATPEFAPGAAVDGAPSTAWTALRRRGATAQGEWIELDVGRPMTVPYLDVTLLAEGDWRPKVEALRVTTEAGSAVTEVSDTEEKQRIAVPDRPSRWYRISFERVTRETDPGLGPGLREVEIPGVTFQRYAQVPADVADLFADQDGQLAYSFERMRVDPAQPFGGSEELTLSRRFEVPRDMTFTVTGTAGVLPPPPGTPEGSDDPLVVECGQGPAVLIAGTRYDTRSEGLYSDVTAVRPLRTTLCTDGGRIELEPGQHLLTVDQGTSTLTIDSVSLVATRAEISSASARSTLITNWSPEERTVEIGAGGRAFFAVRENANASWTATLDGEELTPVRLDGWQQGWIVPDGAGGTLLIENVPGKEYRRNLVVGLVLVALLVVAAVLPRRGRRRQRSNSDSDGYPGYLDPNRFPPLRAAGRIPGEWAGLVLATLAVFLVAGVVAVAVPILVLLRRRWPAVLGGVAVAGMVGSGIAVAAQAGSSPGSGAGAFSWHAQTLGALAFAAAAAALTLRTAPSGAVKSGSAESGAGEAGSSGSGSSGSGASGSGVPEPGVPHPATPERAARASPLAGKPAADARARNVALGDR